MARQPTFTVHISLTVSLKNVYSDLAERLLGSGLPGVHAPSGRDPHADQETPRRGPDTGAAHSQPGAAPPPAPDRTREQQCETLSHRQRPDPSVEARRPRCRDGTVLCPAQLPGAPHALATNGLIGINSIAQPHIPRYLVGLPAEGIDDILKTGILEG